MARRREDDRVTPRYSDRLSWGLPANPLTAALAAQRKAGAPLIDLTVSNPTAVELAYPHQEIAHALGAIPKFLYEPDPAGALTAREAISAYYASRGLSVSPQQILLTASTSEAYGYLFKLLCNPGDEMLIPLPSYPLFEYLARLEGIDTVPYWLRYDGNWHMDFATLRSAITTRTRAIVIVNPNNPTGSFFSAAELKTLMEVAAAHNLPVISDEVFSDYPLAPAGAPRSVIHAEGPLSFSLNGLSKCAGMPQMKLAWIVISGPESQREECRERLELILDTYLSPATPVQAALPALLSIGSTIQRQIQTRIQANLTALRKTLAGSPATVLHTDAGWSAIVQIPRTQSEEEWAMSLLEKHHVVVQPGFFYDMPGEAYVVLSLLTESGAFQEGVTRVGAAVTRGE